MVCLLPATPPAHADELLVMPYACTVAGGRTLLTRGAERGHRIVGQREQRKFTACSPANPGLCRHWTVYRFEVDCDGARVPWVQIVAAASEAGRRAWLVDGRLQLRMPARWGLGPDDPCRYESDRDDPFGDPRRRRYCAERLASAPPVVEMPLGFAPMLGIDAIFVKAGPGVAKALPPPDWTDPPPPRHAGADQSQPMPRGEPPPARPAGEAFAKQTLTRRLPRHRRTACRGSAKAQPPPPGPSSAPKAQDRLPRRRCRRPKRGATSAPKVPRRHPGQEVAPPKQPAPQSPPPPKSAPQPDAKPAAKVAVAPPAPAHKTPAQSPAPANTPAKTTAQPEDTAPAPRLFSFSVLRTTTMGVIVAFTGLSLGLFIAFAVARRRQRPHPAAGVPQRARGLPRLGYDDGREPPTTAASALGRVPGASAADAALAAWGDRMPRTRKEAIQALGIGARRGAADAATLKKIVDVLRVSWHPDRAQDEPDRQLRELRSKQINAAWDLLQGERADA
jgi:hypothetical protein